MPTNQDAKIHYKDDSFAPVEKWNLDPEMMKKAKYYRRLGELSSMLKRGLTQDAARLNVMAKALYDVEMKKDAALKTMEPRAGHLDGQPMDFGQLEIKY